MEKYIRLLVEFMANRDECAATGETLVHLETDSLFFQNLESTPSLLMILGLAQGVLPTGFKEPVAQAVASCTYCQAQFAVAQALIEEGKSDQILDALFQLTNYLTFYTKYGNMNM